MAIVIENYRPELADDFKNLNLEWLQKYFEVEEHDLEQLDDPQKIIDQGGQIFLARENGKSLGTATILNENDKDFELAKMAVTEAAKGRGIGNILMEKCISEAAAAGAQRLILLSNRSLIPAISLYKKFGFTEVPLDNNPYARGNIKMVRQL